MKTDNEVKTPVGGLMAEMWWYRGTCLGIAILVMLVISAWFGLRENYRASAKVEIGGITNFLQGNVPVFIPIETLDDVERFITSAVLSVPGGATFKKCTAVGVVRETQILEIKCKGRTENEVSGRIQAVMQPLVERHRLKTEVARAFSDHESSGRREQIAWLDQRIAELKKRSLAGGELLAFIMLDKIATLEERRINLIAEQRNDELRQQYRRLTSLNKEGIEIVDRTPQLVDWLVAVVIAALSGLVTAFLLGTGRILSNKQSNV